MTEVSYVSEVDHARAREMESRLAALPSEAGVLFISVTAVPGPEGVAPCFEVRLGMQRRFDESTGIGLIKKIFEKEIKDGMNIAASVHRGISGASREGPQASAAARRHPTQ